MSETLNQEVAAAVDKAVGVRLGGIEKQLDEVRALLTRMVRVEEQQTNYKATSERLQRDVDALYERLRIVETTSAVEATKAKNTDNLVWKLVSAGLAIAVAAMEFFRK